MITHSIPRIGVDIGHGRRALRAAAAGFSLVWLIGLAIPVPAVDLDASGRAALDAVTGQEVATALRASFVHGFAALALAAVALGLARATAASGERRVARVAAVAGLTAAGLSVLQWSLELVLAGPVASAGEAGAADALVDAVNRVDGLKMLAIAALAVAGVTAARRVGVLPRWLVLLGPALALSLVIAAGGYGLLIPALAPAAFVALPLLMVWITGSGLSLAGKRGR